jgi:flagellar protein FliS
MNGYGAKAYTRVAVESGVAEGDPHKLILMLYDGAVETVRVAESHMRAGRIPEKCAALTKAVRIVDEGLKAGLDAKAGGPLAQQLGQLYDYMVMRLLQANLRNDTGALREVATLLEDLRSAWQQMPRPTTGAPAAAPAQAAPAQAAAQPAAARAGAVQAAAPAATAKAAPAVAAAPAANAVAPAAARHLAQFGAAPAARKLVVSA